MSEDTGTAKNVLCCAAFQIFKMLFVENAHVKSSGAHDSSCPSKIDSIFLGGNLQANAVYHQTKYQHSFSTRPPENQKLQVQQICSDRIWFNPSNF